MIRRPPAHWPCFACSLLSLLCAPIAAAAAMSCRNRASWSYCAHDREFAERHPRAFRAAQRAAGRRRATTPRRTSRSACTRTWSARRLSRAATSTGTTRSWRRSACSSRASCSRTPARRPLPYPAAFKAKDHTWTAFAARARVLLVNTDKVKKEDLPARPVRT